MRPLTSRLITSLSHSTSSLLPDEEAHIVKQIHQALSVRLIEEGVEDSVSAVCFGPSTSYSGLKVCSQLGKLLEQLLVSMAGAKKVVEVRDNIFPFFYFSSAECVSTELLLGTDRVRGGFDVSAQELY